MSGGGGSGSECTSPLLLQQGYNLWGAHATGALVGSHLFSCGPLTPLPAKWLRFTAPSTGLMTIRVFGVGLDTRSDFILEITDACLPDGGVAAPRCNDFTGTVGSFPSLALNVMAGQTFLVAVGVQSGNPAGFVVSFGP